MDIHSGNKKRKRKAVVPSWDMDRVGRGMALWQEHRPDLDCHGKAVLGRVIQLQDVYLQAVERALAPHGVKYPSYAVIATLRVQGEPFCMSPTELRRTLLLSSGGLTKVLKKVEKEGLVVRKPDLRDGRAMLVELSEKGFSLANAAMTSHTEVEKAFASVLSQEDIDNTARCLSLMIGVRG